jgi:hypothetical protein
MVMVPMHPRASHDVKATRARLHVKQEGADG